MLLGRYSSWWHLVTLGSGPGLSFPFLAFGAAISYRFWYSTLNIKVVMGTRVLNKGSDGYTGVNIRVVMGTRVFLRRTRVSIHNHTQIVLYT